MYIVFRWSAVLLIHGLALSCLAAEPAHPGEDRVVVGNSLVIGPDEIVENAVAVGGQLDIQGQVTGNAVAVGGDLTIHPGAIVENDAVSVGAAAIASGYARSATSRSTASYSYSTR